MKPLPIHPELEEKIAGRNPDGKLWLQAGDSEYIYRNAEGEEIVVGMRSRANVLALVTPQSEALKAMRLIASPETRETIQKMGELPASLQTHIANLFGDPEALGYLHSEIVFNTLNRIPLASVAARDKFFEKVKKRVEATVDNPDALIDRFTLEDRQRDYEYNLQTVEMAKAALKKNSERSLLNPFKYEVVRRTALLRVPSAASAVKNGVAKSMNQLTTVLRFPLVQVSGAFAAVGGAADYYANHGQNVQTVIDAMALQLTRFQSAYLNILNDIDYTQDLLTYALPAQTCLFLSVVVIALIAQIRSQKTAAQLLTINGIKLTFAKFLIPPQRLALTIMGKKRLLALAKMGSFNPIELLPFVGPRDTSPRAQQLQKQKRLKSLATGLAINAAAAEHGVDPLAILKDPKFREDAVILAQNLNASLQASSQELGMALLDGDFTKSYEDASEATKKLIADGATIDVGLSAWTQYEMLPSLVSSVANFGESTYETLSNPRPDRDFSAYVTRAILSIVVSR